VTEIPWGHNIVLIHKVRDPVTRVWYARKTLEYGWSRAVLVAQIESRLHKREGMRRIERWLNRGRVIFFNDEH
jgi:predicted nuclease of restriction endonuclease-like (RecB) superfamily